MPKYTKDYAHITESHVTVSGDYCFVRGDHNTVTGDFCHVTGDHNTVSGDFCHVRGEDNTVTGDFSMHNGKGKGKGKDSYIRNSFSAGVIGNVTGNGNVISGARNCSISQSTNTRIGAGMSIRTTGSNSMTTISGNASSLTGHSQSCKRDDSKSFERLSPTSIRFDCVKKIEDGTIILCGGNQLATTSNGLNVNITDAAVTFNNCEKSDIDTWIEALRPPVSEDDDEE